MTEGGEDERLKRIRERAYELWEAEGCPQGRDDVHWRQASDEFDEAQREQSLARDTGPAQPVPETGDGGSTEGQRKRRSKKAL